MFSRLFGWPKKEENPSATIDKLDENLEMCEKEKKDFQDKIQKEDEKAKALTRANDKRGAMRCLKMKKHYEEEIRARNEFQDRIHEQKLMLSRAKSTKDVVSALKTGASTMKAMQKATDIALVDKIMDKINEQTENMKQIQEALATPIGAAADFDEEGAELEEQLLQPAVTAPAAQYPQRNRRRTHPTPQSSTTTTSSSARSGATTF